jgi:hypothetical protein
VQRDPFAVGGLEKQRLVGLIIDIRGLTGIAAKRFAAASASISYRLALTGQFL